MNYTTLMNFFRKLIGLNYSLYNKNSNGDTHLYAAFKAGRFVDARAILDNCSYGFDPANEDDNLLHFHIACIMREFCAIGYFIKKGINPTIPISINPEEFAGLSPIELTIKENYFSMFTRLVNDNGHLLFVSNEKGSSIIHTLYYSSIPNSVNWIEHAFANKRDKKFINFEDEYGLSHFHLSCMVNNPDFAKNFINNGVDVNKSVSAKSSFNAGFSPLHFAVKYDCERVIYVLLENDADPNATDASGETPLHLACQKSSKLAQDIVQVLLVFKADPHIEDKNGCTPLHTIFYHVDIEHFFNFHTLLSTMQWGSTNRTDKQGLSFFHIVCTTDNVPQVSRFLNSGVKINRWTSSEKYRGFRALHFAVLHNQVDVVEELLLRNADVNVTTDESKSTPLHLACEFNMLDQEKSVEDSSGNWLINQLKIIRLLLSFGADVNAVDSFGATPLLRTFIIDEWRRCWNDYSYDDEDIERERSEKVTQAIQCRWDEIIKTLLFKNANVNVRLKDQSSILHILCKYSLLETSESVMGSLVAAGVDLNAADSDGLTPLHVAVEKKNKHLVKNLLKYGANPNIRCKKSRTPLQMIAKRVVREEDRSGSGYSKYYNDTICAIFSMLIDNGSCINVVED